MYRDLFFLSVILKSNVKSSLPIVNKKIMLTKFIRYLSVVQWIFDLSTFDLRKFFDLRKNFTVPKILVHKMFDLRKISRTPFFDLRKKNQAFWGKKGNFWQKMLKLELFFSLKQKKTWKNCICHPIWIVGHPI